MAEFKIPTIDDLSRDYESIRDTLLATVPFFTPEWTDLNPTDFGVVLVELLAMGLDTLHFNVDNQLRQGFITTATSRKAIINLLKLIDFELRSATPASVDVVFTLGAVQASDVLIPEDTVIRTLADDTTPAVTFETNADLTITTGSLGNETSGGSFLFEIGAVEGESGGEDIGISDGTSFQEFTLVSVPIIDGTLAIFVDEGGGDVLWTEINSFADALPTDESYVAQRDEVDRITIRFGDNANGKIPVATSEIRGEFRTGGGEIGNVGADTIKTIESTILLLGEPVSLTVTNPLQATGGEERQTIEEARRLGPLSLRALGRAVSEQDYKTLAEQIGGVAKAKVVPGALPFEVDLFIVAEGGGVPSQVLLDAVEDELEEINCVGTDIITKAPTFVTVEIEGTVTAFANFQNAVVSIDVIAALEGFFDESRADIDFGKDIRLSDIFRLVDEVTGVDFVEYTRLTRTPVVEFQIQSGDYTVSSIAITDQTVTETWTIRFTNTTDFTATGTVSGLQIATGTLDAQYVSDNTEVTFTVSSGTIAPALSDNFTFKTSPLVGSVILSDNEFPLLGSLAGLVVTGGAD